MPFWDYLSPISGGITGALSIINSIRQNSQAKKLMRENPFPNAAVPQGVQDATKLAELNSYTGLPGEQYNQVLKNIGRNENSAIGAANDRRGGLGMIGQIQQGANDAVLNLGAESARQRAQKQGEYINQKNILGQWQNNAWDWNKKQRYVQNAAAIRGLLGASRANANTGIDRILGGGIQASGIASDNKYGNPYSMQYQNINSGRPRYTAGNEDIDYSDFQTED